MRDRAGVAWAQSVLWKVKLGSVCLLLDGICLYPCGSEGEVGLDGWSGRAISVPVSVSVPKCASPE